MYCKLDFFPFQTSFETLDYYLAILRGIMYVGILKILQVLGCIFPHGSPIKIIFANATVHIQGIISLFVCISPEMWDSVKPMLNPSSVNAWYYVYVMSRITVIEFTLIKDPLYKKNLGLSEVKDENFCKLHLSHISSNGLRFLLFLVTDY